MRVSGSRDVQSAVWREQLFDLARKLGLNDKVRLEKNDCDTFKLALV